MKFYKVSGFADMIGVSSSTLRMWDYLGILKPHHRSPSGYRYYSEEQLKEYFEKGIVRVKEEKK